MFGRFVRVAAIGAAITAPIGAYAFVLRPWAKRWGVDPTEAATLLPGDELIEDITGQETRGITIEAAPGDVWPWLIQMGFGRGGWYSYDQLDMLGRSADELVPEWQSLAVGDVVPTHPHGGFVVKGLEPGRSLTLYMDGDLVREQAAADEAEPGADLAGGLAVSGALMRTQPTDFKASWTFVVRPEADGTTRLIERVRFQYPEQAVGGRLATEGFGFGVFLMMRKQMLEIRRRAERLAASNLPAAYVPPVVDAPTPA